jgi:hypothetical protein
MRRRILGVRVPRGSGIRTALLALAALAAASCDSAQSPLAKAAPSPELTKRAVLALLPGLQFGPDPAAHTYREILSVEVAGAHFVPAIDRWVVHYCVEYTSRASDDRARRCDQSVDVYELDTKKWVGFARGVGTLYRWQILDEKSAASSPPNAPDGAAPAASGDAP